MVTLYHPCIDFNNFLYPTFTLLSDFAQQVYETVQLHAIIGNGIHSYTYTDYRDYGSYYLDTNPED